MMSLDGTANAAAKVRTFAAALAVPSKLITVSYPSLQTGSQCPKNVVYRMCPSHANLVSKKTIIHKCYYTTCNCALHTLRTHCLSHHYN